MSTSRTPVYRGALTILLLAGALPAAAGIIFDNGSPNHMGAFASDLDDENDFNHAIMTADNFVLTSPSTRVTDVHWWGYYDSVDDIPPITVDDFSIIFYEDDGGNPGNLVAQFDAGMVTRVPDVNDVFMYEYVLPAALDLQAGTTYYVSIVNNTAGPSRWLWNFSGPGDGWQRDLPGGDWGLGFSLSDTSFRLTGNVVPEPAGLSLLGMGIAGMALRRWKRRNS
jgi:hypothetical protein